MLPPEALLKLWLITATAGAKIIERDWWAGEENDADSTEGIKQKLPWCCVSAALGALLG